jgi:hypothetical protein
MRPKTETAQHLAQKPDMARKNPQPAHRWIATPYRARNDDSPYPLAIETRREKLYIKGNCCQEDGHAA